MRSPLILLTLFFPFLLSAQFAGIGVGAGGASSAFDYGEQVDAINEFDSQRKLGGTGGIKFDFNLGSENFKLTPEIFIIQNGSREFYTEFNALQNDIINRRVQLDYLGLYMPLNIYIPIDDGNGVTDYTYHGIIFNASGFIDYVINAAIDSDGFEKTEVAFRSNADKIDFGFSFNFGFVFNGMFMKFGYDQGIRNIEFYNALGDVDDENYLVNNNGFTLTVGYLYKIE